MTMFDLSRQTLATHSVDMRQFISCDEATLPNGMRLLNVYNSSGLTFTLLPDRGLDIWTAQFNGVPLTWISQSSPHLPDYGSAWLRQFNGGLLTTCGLQHVGGAEADSQTGELRDVHGQFTRQRAQIQQIRGDWQDDVYVLEIRAIIAQARLFGEQLRVERTYRVTLGVPDIEITDVVHNLGDEPAPLMLLYHVNVGYPLVRGGARLVVPSAAVHPRDARAHEGLTTWADYDSATASYAEQVFYHHLNAQDSQTSVLMTNGDIGLSLSWDVQTMPYFTQWKNTRRGMYVCGIEPGNCVPEGQNAAREGGRLTVLDAGEARRFGCCFRVLHDADAQQRAIRKIKQIEAHGLPIAGFNWTG